MERLPDDLIRIFAIFLDYDDLLNYRLSNKVFYNLVNNPIFWADKINHDFGITLSRASEKLYVKIATENYHPVRGSEKYADSNRDLLRLIFNATKRGKLTNRLRKKLTHPQEQVNFITEIGLAFKDGAPDQGWTERNIIGNLLAGRPIEAIIDMVILNHCYNLAAIIRGDTELPRYYRSQAYEYFSYAILFDNIPILHQTFAEIPELDIFIQAARYGNPDTIQFIGDAIGGQLVNNLDIMLEYASYNRNLRGINKLVDLGARITVEYIEENCSRGSRKLIKALLKLTKEKITPEVLNNLIFEAARFNNLPVAELLFDLGASGDRALHGAITEDYSDQVKYWLTKNNQSINEALIHAVNCRASKSIKILIDAGANTANAAIMSFISHKQSIPGKLLQDIMVGLIDSRQVNINEALLKVIDIPPGTQFFHTDLEMVNILIHSGASNFEEVLYNLLTNEIMYNDHYWAIVQMIVDTGQIEKQHIVSLLGMYQNHPILKEKFLNR